jgi:non-ribosomal peptide synthetase component F
LYNAFLEGQEPQLVALPLQYADYAVWQRNFLQGEILDKKIAYWKQKLEDISPLQLPTDFTRPPVKGAKGASASFNIDKSLLLQLHELSRQQGASLFMVLLAAFKVLLYRYSGQQDISVGTSIASRQQKELEGLVGFFVNTLCLRDKVIAGASFTELIQQVKTTTLEAYQHQELPFEKVVEAVVNERDTSRSPLFQVMLVLANTPESSKLKLGEVALAAEPVATRVSKFDLTFFMNETANGLNGTIEYSTDLFKADTIKRMTAHFEMLLNSVVKDPKQQIGHFAMIGKEESHLLLEAYNNCKVNYPAEKSITTIFEEQVEKTPNTAALVFGD